MIINHTQAIEDAFQSTSNLAMSYLELLQIMSTLKSQTSSDASAVSAELQYQNILQSYLSALHKRQKIIISDYARQANIFQNSKNMYLKIQHYEEDNFTAINENTGGVFIIKYEDVNLETETFFKLTKV